MLTAKLEAWSSKMMGSVSQHLFAQAQRHANKAFSTLTTELSMFIDPVLVIIWEPLHHVLFPNADLEIAVPARQEDSLIFRFMHRFC